ncbi:hypothetical protein [Streptomyces sp. NPDC050504]|uniref:hypothetical protein n=1 Tax=Streptomyces sp. NPDC050504 TaxID=3365618 RepID=UPI0037BAAE9B
MAHPGTPPRPAQRRGGCLQALVVLAVVLGLGYGASVLFGDGKGSKGSSASKDGSGSTGAWKVGDCGGPDPDDAPDGFRKIGCEDSTASFKALEIQPGSMLPDSVQCPAGTDLIIKVSVSYGSGDKKTGGGIPTSTVCGRNLAAPHPGDAGEGGGQLVVGDCVSSTAQEVKCASAGGSDFKVLALAKSEATCPSGTTEPMKLTMAIGRPYDVICGGKV